MDFFTMPDRAEGGFAYAYIIMIFVFIAASFTVNRLKRANKKRSEKENVEEVKMYEYEENDINHSKE
ncbi:hypothetical protein [Evansella cellulosilytica]|uniref:Uncharacterized protein n=1 Tax=Evansella cellulosilytica (strain ATCC 21833 / DSM 2522 / FERM P-1141 / JCM 9156 / N-4) TaxID=649639 RepID=E6TUB2_EVAC2|nr:hypothetical protein [Evansella cellulosilytica]ADU29668.1 hypothetical protein Bcell_1405 [Evansella cellulosilytica DSM 2522]